MADVVFDPWVGVTYGRESRWGFRLMLLGESHYDEGFQQGTGLTSFVVRQHMTRSAEGRHAFWTKIARAIAGPQYSDAADRTSFWESISFYNYVQGFVGVGPRKRPTPRQFTESHPAFLEVIRELRPDLVVCLGFGLWDVLQQSVGPVSELPAPAAGKRKCQYAICPEAKPGLGMLGYIKHPSTGFSYETWSTWLRAYSDLVRNRLAESGT